MFLVTLFDMAKIMRIAETKTPKGERSRVCLLEAALRIIGEAGIEALTFRRVAEEAGLTRGAVTYHFGSREEIILHAFRHYIGTVSRQLALVGSELGDDGVEGVIEGLVRYYEREFRDATRVLAEYELILFAARNDAIAREVRAWENALTERLARLLGPTGIGDPKQTAHLMLAIFRAFELERLTRQDTRPEELRMRLRAVAATGSQTQFHKLSTGRR